MEQPDSNTTPDATQDAGVIDDVQEEQNVSIYERHEPSFFAMVPKMAQMDLTPYELALYTNLKQTASDGGSVTKSNRTLAFETQMSIASVKRARKSLETKGYIRVEHRVNEQGVQNQTNVITLRDVWALNHHRFKTQKEFATGVGLTEPGGVHTEPGGGSHSTTSKNYKSKTSSKKKDSSSPKATNPIKDALNASCYKSSGAGYLLGPLTSWLKGEADYVTANGEKTFVRRIEAQSVENIKAFAAWYGLKRDRSGKALTMPRNVASFVQEYLEWMDTKPAPRIPVYVAPSEPAAPSGVTPEQVRADRERFSQLTGEL